MSCCAAGCAPPGGCNGNCGGCGGGCCGYGDLGHCGTPCCCCPCGDIRNTIVPIQLDRCCKPCKIMCCGCKSCPTRCPDCACMNLGSPQIALGCGKCICPPRERREKRWPQCNFIKPCLDGNNLFLDEICPLLQVTRNDDSAILLHTNTLTLMAVAQFLEHLTTSKGTLFTT
ncbi:unnamed protein product [Allacma fusca]|uniref:Uncharacterized protein n=1 Tax=Allacma fusca TaxID=39272 RepID=A0A8J2KN17_9HEXA|nr:unnamed protein product [Allacma fusca]